MPVGAGTPATSHQRSGIFKTPLLPEGGYLQVPDGPGLGVELDEDAVAQLSKE
ncbi:MAG: hypothetical protein AVDCRST_MAG77-757 [uncultured Chloroflexi bacterium]|uniref:Enolase C-terminal domain-containing protein n=1 Tax=uncultured Chloroflexota bacterium TaxID=166587 RepID=A0A6J4HEV6_9CHLR|nr:MAG: hypothetical protein AVDCRST_MAG77-757 [uncultured Chloroflexota bacterium]